MSGFELKVSILGVPYTIVCDEAKLAEACEEEGLEVENTQGLHIAHDFATRVIYVSPLLSPAQWVQTLFHEVLHAIGNITGHWRLGHSNKANEMFVDAIATGLTSFFLNKNVRKVIEKILSEEEDSHESEKNLAGD